jgi:hypothetical protein
VSEGVAVSSSELRKKSQIGENFMLTVDQFENPITDPSNPSTEEHRRLMNPNTEPRKTEAEEAKLEHGGD